MSYNSNVGRARNTPWAGRCWRQVRGQRVRRGPVSRRRVWLGACVPSIQSPAHVLRGPRERWSRWYQQVCRSGCGFRLCRRWAIRVPGSPRRGIRRSLALRFIINAASFRSGHADGALNQRALSSGRLWSDTDRSSRAGSSAPPAEIETPEDESERREGCDCEMGQYGFHGEDRTGGPSPTCNTGFGPGGKLRAKYRSRIALRG